MTNPVFDPQQPADTAVQPEPPVAQPGPDFAQPGPDFAPPQPPATEPGLDFEVYTPAYVPPQQEPVVTASPVPSKPKKTGVVVLAVFTVLLFCSAGAFGALFFVEKKHSAELTTQIEGKDREITDLGKKAKDSKDEAVKAADAQTKAEAAQRKAEAEAATSQQCRDAARELRAAAIANDEAKGTAAGRNIFTHC